MLLTELPDHDASLGVVILKLVEGFWRERGDFVQLGDVNERLTNMADVDLDLGRYHTVLGEPPDEVQIPRGHLGRELGRRLHTFDVDTQHGNLLSDFPNARGQHVG